MVQGAHYDPSLNGGLGGYYDYPTGSDSSPGRDMTEATNTGNNANYYTSSYLLGTYYRTNVGEFELSTSPFGTFDQGGNVWEWNETPIGGDRGLRGGSFFNTNSYLPACQLPPRPHPDVRGPRHRFSCRLVFDNYPRAGVSRAAERRPGGTGGAPAAGRPVTLCSLGLFPLIC